MKALVLFVSNQPMDALRSIAHALGAGELAGVFLYHTEATAAAAAALHRFCVRQWPSLRTILPGEPGGETPEKCAERLRDWRVMRPDVTNWLVDCTGAAPAHLAAVSRVACEQGATLFGRDARGEWHAYRAASGGRLIPSPLKDAPGEDDADGVDLPALLELLADGAAELVWHGSRAPVRLAPAELDAIAALGPSTNWAWRENFEKATRRLAPAEWGFEDFLGSLLQSLGIGGVRVHLPVRLTSRTPAEQTFDVVALRHGEIWAFDCQFGVDGATDQAYDHRPWEVFGQRVVAVRPGRRETYTESLVSSGRRLVLDSRDCRSFFTRIADLLGLPLPKELAGAERRSLSRAATTAPVFAPSSAARQFSDDVHISPFLYHLRRGADIDAGGRPAPWYAARVGRDLWLLSGTLPKPVPPQEARRRLAGFLSGARMDISVLLFEVAEGRMDWTCVIRAKGNPVQLEHLLQRRANVPLFT